MRHRVYGKKLGRNANERTTLFRQLVQDLILHGSIQTTETKAKAVKGLVDKIINQAKSKNTQRLLQTFFNNKQIREKLVKDIAPNLKDRTSGYTSVVKLGQRKGDNAMVVRMSLLLSEEGNPSTALGTRVKSEKSEEKKPRARRKVKK